MHYVKNRNQFASLFERGAKQNKQGCVDQAKHSDNSPQYIYLKQDIPIEWSGEIVLHENTFKKMSLKNF